MASSGHRHERRLVEAALIVLLAPGAIGLASACGAEPPAPATPAEIVAYHDSGEWASDTSAVIARARRYLDAHAGGTGPRHPALALDIDDTSLSTFACLRLVAFDRAAADCGASRDLPAIPQTRSLYRDARAHGVAVFFITGRHERLRASSVANLHAQGFGGRLRLLMRPDGRSRGTNARYKLRQRHRLAARGYHVIVNVGDQRSDLRGGGAARGFKLPNPMYVTR